MSSDEDEEFKRLRRLSKWHSEKREESYDRLGKTPTVRLPSLQRKRNEMSEEPQTPTNTDEPGQSFIRNEITTAESRLISREQNLPRSHVVRGNSSIRQQIMTAESRLSREQHPSRSHEIRRESSVRDNVRTAGSRSRSQERYRSNDYGPRKTFIRTGDNYESPQSTHQRNHTMPRKPTNYHRQKNVPGTYSRDRSDVWRLGNPKIKINRNRYRDYNAFGRTPYERPGLDEATTSRKELQSDLVVGHRYSGRRTSPTHKNGHSQNHTQNNDVPSTSKPISERTVEVVGSDIPVVETLSVATENQVEADFSDDQSTAQPLYLGVDDESVPTDDPIVGNIQKSSSSPLRAKSVLNDFQVNISNSLKQMGCLYSSLGAALHAKNSRENEIIKMRLENHDLKIKSEELQKKSEAQILSLQNRIQTMAEIIVSLKEQNKELKKIYNQANKEENVLSVPIQDLRKCRRLERIDLLLPTIDRIRGNQKSEGDTFNANKMIIDELAGLLNIDIAPLKLSPYEDYCAFIKNGITFGQRYAIKKSLISIDRDVMAGNNAVFSWKADFESEFKNLYRAVEIEVDGVQIPLVYVHDLKTLLKRKIDSLASEGLLNTDGKYGNKVWLGFVIDKGAEYTKLIAHIANTPSPGSMTSTLILGVYRGDEDNETLRKCFKNIAAQINELDHVEVDSKEIKIAKFFTGDMKTMTSVIGLQSCASLFFCIFCHFSKRECSSDTWLFDQRGTNRSFSTLLECFDKYKDFIEKNMKHAAQLSFSVTHPPLFNFPLENYIPSSLHIFLGLGNLLICLLEFEVIVFDLKLCGFDVSNLKQQCDIVKIVATLESDKKQLLLLQKEMNSEFKTMVAVMKILSTVANPQERKKKKKDVVERCQGTRCLHEDSINYGEQLPKSEIFTCLICRKWFHAICELYVCKDDVNVVKTNGYVCSLCQVPSNSSIVIIQKKIDDQNIGITKLDQKLTEIESKIVIVQKVITNKSGETYLKLQKTFTKCGASKNLYFVTYNGNHLRKLFRSSSLEEIFSIPGLRSTLRLQQLELLMSNLQELQDYSCARFLLDDEITKMRECIKKFIGRFSDAYPYMNTTSKMHWLGSHLMDFVENWKMWGLISEQAIESFHAEWNKTERRFTAFGDTTSNAYGLSLVNSNHNNIVVNVYGRWKPKTSKQKNIQYRRKKKAASRLK